MRHRAEHRILGAELHHTRNELKIGRPRKISPALPYHQAIPSEGKISHQMGSSMQTT